MLICSEFMKYLPPIRLFCPKNLAVFWGAISSSSLIYAGYKTNQVLYPETPPPSEYFGAQIEHGNGRLLIASPEKDVTAQNIANSLEGKVDVYRKSSGQWVFEQTLPLDNTHHSKITDFGERLHANDHGIAVQYQFSLNGEYSVALYDWSDLSTYSVVSIDHRYASFGYQSYFIDKNSVLVSAPREEYGAVYLFRRYSDSWVQAQRIGLPDLIESLDPIPGNNWYSQGGDGLGFDIDGNGEEVAISCPEESLVFLFELAAEGLYLKQTIDLSNGYPDKEAGYSISFNGSRLFISAPSEDVKLGSSGAIYCYKKDEDGIYHLEQKLHSEFAGDLGSQIETCDNFLASAMTDDTKVILFNLDDGGQWRCHGMIQGAPEEPSRIHHTDLLWNADVPGNLMTSVVGYSMTSYPVPRTEVCRDIDLSTIYNLNASAPSIAPGDGVLRNNLGWSPTPGASIYEVFRSENDSLASASLLKSTTRTTYLDVSDLEWNRHYYYWILPKFDNCTLLGPTSTTVNWDGENVYRIRSSEKFNKDGKPILNLGDRISRTGLSSDGKLYASGEHILKNVSGTKLEIYQNLENVNHRYFLQTIFSPSDEWLVWGDGGNLHFFKRNQNQFYEYHQKFDGAYHFNGIALSDDTLFGAAEDTITVLKLNASGQWEAVSNFERPYQNIGHKPYSGPELKFLNGKLAVWAANDPRFNDDDYGIQGLYFFEETAPNVWTKTDELLVDKRFTDIDWDGERIAICGVDNSLASKFLRVYRDSAQGEWELEAEIVPNELEEWSDSGYPKARLEQVSIRGEELVFSLGNGNVYYFVLDQNGQWNQQARISAEYHPSPVLGFIDEHGFTFQEDDAISFVEVLSKEPLKVPQNPRIVNGSLDPKLVWNEPDNPFGFVYEIKEGRRPQIERGYLSEIVEGTSYSFKTFPGQTTHLRVRAKTIDGSRYSQWSDIIAHTFAPSGLPLYVEQSAPLDLGVPTDVNQSVSRESSIVEIGRDCYVAISSSAHLRIYKKSDGTPEWVIHQDVGSPPSGRTSYVSKVELSRNYLFIGSPTTVEVYERNEESSSWEFKTKVDRPVVGDKQFDEFAASIAWNSPFLAVSAPYDYPDGGEILLFRENDEGNFELHQIVDYTQIPGNEKDDFGRFMKLENEYLVAFLGSHSDEKIYVYEKDSDGLFKDPFMLPTGNPGIDFDLHDGEIFIVDKDSESVDIYEKAEVVGWRLQQEVSLPDLASLTTSTRYSIAVSGRVMCLGAYFDDTDQVLAGGLLVYLKDSLGIWKPVGRVSDFDPATGNGFGFSVELASQHGVVLSKGKVHDPRLGEDLIHFLSIADWVQVLNDDSDDNGLPDSWERSYGISGSDHDLSFDADGDGLSLWEESLLQTDPYSRDSGLILTKRVEDGFAHLSIGNPRGVGDYILLFRNSFSGAWNEIFRWTDPGERVPEFVHAHQNDHATEYKLVFEPARGPDQDRNGLGDLWELEYFRHTGVDPQGDADQDGLSNEMEYRLRYHPKSSRERLQLNIGSLEGMIGLSVSEVRPEYIYILEFKEDLNLSEWEEIYRWDSLLLMRNVSVSDNLAGGTGFYRLRIVEK